jgi:predicted phosphodiesterase
MRIGLIADVHGNLPALDAVLQELEREDVDEIICLGDVAVGPEPVATLERVRELGCRVVMGNWDAYFLDSFPSSQSALEERLVEIGAWWAGQLEPEHLQFMRGFEPTITIELAAGHGLRLLAFHGSPRSFEDCLLPTTPDAELDRLLDGAGRARLLVAGHTHFQMVRRHGEALLVNPGSVGLPFFRPADVMSIAPWAEYAVLVAGVGPLSVDVRRTTFDVEALLGSIRSSGMPHADWWADLWAMDLAVDAAARPGGGL